MNPPPSTEDRIWAVISHLSALAFGMGIVLPVIGWSDQRRKSNYASFQSLQALGYQSLGFTVWVLSYLVLIILVAIILLVVFGSTNTQTLSTPWVVVLSVVMIGFFAIYLVLPVIAAVACALGRDFRYPFMGDRLARYLDYDPTPQSDLPAPLNEDHEVRWIAAMGHFSILVMVWGMLAPLAAWVLHGKRSSFLKFQSIQTLVYQAATTILYFVALFFYLFGFVLLVATMGSMGTLELNSSTGIVGIVIFGGSLLVSFVLILSVPLLHILGQWAGYRVLKGDEYRYPLVGRLVDQWLSKKSTLEEKIA